MHIFPGNIYVVALLIIAVAFLITLIAYLNHCFTYWKRRGVYTPPPSVPFGNAANLVLQKKFPGTELKNIYDVFKRKGLRYGGYYIFGKPVFIPVDLDLVKQILVKDFDHFTDHLMYVDVKNQPLTGHIFGLKGDTWKKLRLEMSPTFTSGKIKMMFNMVVECAKGFLPEVDRMITRDEPLEAKDLFSRFTTDVIGSCAFGLECNSFKNPTAEFAAYCQKFFGSSIWYSTIRSLSFFSPGIFDYIKIPTIPKDMHDFFLNIVKQTVNYRTKNNVVRNDFMHLLMQLRKKNDVEKNNTKEQQHTAKIIPESCLTTDEIAAQCFVIFLAGYESSSTTLTFCLYELAKNQEIQEKVRKEVNTVLNKHGGKITYDATMEMHFMEMCFDETLRKHSPAALHTRACTKRYQVPNSNLILEKGTFVLIPIYGIQLDPEIYPDPQKFDPERFSTKNKAARHPSAWIPFGDGPRICLGLRFSVVEMKVALAILLKNYRFKLNPKTKTPIALDPKYPISANVLGGIWVDVEKITQ